MSEMKQAWMAMMCQKYGTDEAGVRAIMSQRQAKSMASPKRQQKPHRAGFSSMSKERLQEVSKRGVDARQVKKDDQVQDAL